MNKTFLYSIAIEPMEEGGYFANCPALQGAHAEGQTIAKAIENIEDIIKKIREIELAENKNRKEEIEWIKGFQIKEKSIPISLTIPVTITK